MTYTEREIARLEGMKDGLIKKLVDECEEINDQIIALRKGKPRKKDSEIYFDKGYAKGVQDTISTIKEFTKDWNKQSNKRVPYFAIDELIEYITQKEQKQMNGYYNRPCIYSETDPCFVNCKNKNCPYYTEDDEEEYEEEDEEE